MVNAGSLKYHVSSTIRRKQLDRLMRYNAWRFKEGTVVLDIGGRDRGEFAKPKKKVARWIFADIQPENKPDLILDVCDMKQVATASIDTIVATELFEHVHSPERGLAECSRVLRSGGEIIASMPFLYPIHGDPHDYQRWTKSKWELELGKAGFEPLNILPMGGFFSVMIDLGIVACRAKPAIFRLPGLAALFLLQALTLFDNKETNFRNGYFIVAEKK